MIVTIINLTSNTISTDIGTLGPFQTISDSDVSPSEAYAMTPGLDNLRNAGYINYSITDGVRDSLVWRPGGISSDGVATTWDEVDEFAQTASIPWTLYVDTSIAAAEIPSTADTEFNNLVTFFSASGSAGTQILIKDGGVIRNPYSIGQACGIACEAATTPGIVLSTAGAIFLVSEGGQVGNVSGMSAEAAIVATSPTTIFVVGSGASLSHQETSVPLVDFTYVGAFIILPMSANTSGLDTPIPDNCLQGDATAVIINIRDATAYLGDQTSFFDGTILVQGIEKSALLDWSNGGTGSRPASPTAGQMYFDSDLGKPIWWDGAAWVDSNGGAV